jgi:uncharacterized heparinase superfamily protein
VSPLGADLGRELQFLRHLRPRQVARRLVLAGKHRLLARLGPRHRGRAQPAALRAALPGTLFPPRRIPLELAPDRIRLTFLNEARTLARPVPWTLPDLPPEHLLWKMHLNYMEYLEALDDAAVVQLVRDWIAHNPPYRPGYWAGIWHPYSLSIRIVVWLQQMAARPHLDADFRREVAASVGQQAQFLARNLETDLGGNHLIKNLKALLFAAASLDHAEGPAWRRLALRHLARELELQVLADGMHFERSASYHAQVFADLLECHQVLGDDPHRARLAAVLDRMAAATAALTHPDGGPALFNDSGLHMAYPPAACLDAYGRSRGRPPPPARSLPAAGYYRLRSGATFFLADCGPIAPDHLPAHGHGDILSFEWSVRGHRVVVDPGVFTYHAGPERQAARSAAAHNTVTVGEADQADFFGAFRMGRRARARCCHHHEAAGRLELEGTHDGFCHLAGSPAHTRRFEVTALGLTIRDRVAGGAGQPVRARLLLHPDWRIETAGCRALLTRGDVRIQLEASAAVVAETAGWWPDLGVERRTCRLVVTYGPAPAHGRLDFRVLHPSAP